MGFRVIGLVMTVLVVVGVIDLAGSHVTSGLLVAQRRAPVRPGAVPGIEEPPWEARTLVRGRVEAVDPVTGRVKLNIGGSAVEAVFPGTVVARLKAGNVVFVTVAVIDTHVAAVTGSVIAVEPQRGTMTVTTAQGPVTMPASPAALDRLKSGDEVVLKLSLTDIGPPPEPPAAPPGTTSPR